MHNIELYYGQKNEIQAPNKGSFFLETSLRIYYC